MMGAQKRIKKLAHRWAINSLQMNSLESPKADSEHLSKLSHGTEMPLWSIHPHFHSVEEVDFLLAGSCMSGNVPVQFAEKDGGQKCLIPHSRLPWVLLCFSWESMPI